MIWQKKSDNRKGDIYRMLQPCQAPDPRDLIDVHIDMLYNLASEGNSNKLLKCYQGISIGINEMDNTTKKHLGFFGIQWSVVLMMVMGQCLTNIWIQKSGTEALRVHGIGLGC